jgi:hypothetical protein
VRTASGLSVGLIAILLGSGILRADAPELQKPAPAAEAQPYRARIEQLLVTHYPRLLVERLSGAQTVLFLFNPDGSLAATALEEHATGQEALVASELQFARFGVSAGELRYIGAASLQLPLNKVVVVFAGRDSRQVDRALVEHYFPDALARGAPPGASLWILFDHEGRVLRTGSEHVDPAQLRKLLAQRYAGIALGDLTAAAVYGRDGRPVKNAQQETLQLYSVWLSSGSPVPSDR